jgi:hypothetical protein
MPLLSPRRTQNSILQFAAASELQCLLCLDPSSTAEVEMVLKKFLSCLWPCGPSLFPPHILRTYMMCYAVFPLSAPPPSFGSLIMS